MSGDAWNVALNIIASAITGSVVWLTGRLVGRRRMRRKREFFGLVADSECLLVVPRHASATERSVHRNDAAALLELSTIIGDCGARPEVIFHDQPYQGLGDKAEFCLGGPAANQRTKAHLRSAMPGVSIVGYGPGVPLDLFVADESYQMDVGRVEYVALAKIVRNRRDKPTFVICGQSSASNRAAGRYLAENYRKLLREHGTRGRFCLVLRVLESDVYGPTVVELVRDATDDAFTRNVLVTDATAS